MRDYRTFRKGYIKQPWHKGCRLPGMKFLVGICFFVFQHIFPQTSETEVLQHKIEATLSKEPAQAVQHLKLLLSEEYNIHDTIASEAYRKLGIGMIKMAEYDSAIFYFRKGVERSSEFPLKKARVATNLAMAYRSSSKYEYSLKTLSDVLDIYQNLQDSVGIAVVYGEMASNYNYMLEDEKAVKYLKEGIAILEKKGKTKNLVVLKQKLANNYFNNGNFEFASELYQEVLPVFEEEGSSNYYYTLLNYGDCLYYLEDYRESLKKFQIAEQGLKRMNNEEFAFFAQSKKARVHIQLGEFQEAFNAYDAAFNGLCLRSSPRLAQVVCEYLDLLNSNGEYDKALSVIEQYKLHTKQKGAQSNQNFRDQLEFLEQSYLTYKNKGMLGEALELSENIRQLNDSITRTRNEKRIAEVQEKYQNQIQKEKNTLLNNNIDLLQNNIRRKNNIILLSVLVLFLLAFSTWFFFKRMTYKDKLRKLTVENMNNQKNMLEQKHRAEKLKGKEREQIIEAKQREMVATSLELANVQQKIKELLNEESTPENSAFLKKKLLKVLNERNYWNEFQFRFTEIHPKFFHNLKEKFPQLTKNDLQFCSFLKLGLTNKEIATLLGISPQSVITKKYRIRKKVEMDDNRLEAFLKQL